MMFKLSLAFKAVLLLLCMLVACGKAQNITDSNVQQQQKNVPLFLSNLTRSAGGEVAATLPVALPVTSAGAANLSSSGISAFKAPLRRSNSSLDSLLGSLQASPSSVFLSNFNNQQNVQLLVRNIEARLRSIRNVEMSVSNIQEIFDSWHISATSRSSSTKYRSNNESQPRNAQNQNNEQLHQQQNAEQDLQIFAKRISRKLQKAIHVVHEMRDFLQSNITKVLLHFYAAESESDDYDLDNDNDDVEAATDDDEDDDVEDESDFVLDDKQHLHLHTIIESFVDQAEQNYNKQQIQILNYLKTEAGTAELTARSVAANSYIADKLHTLKNSLTKDNNNHVQPPAGSSTNLNGTSSSNNSKLKYVGTHFKHIYFLSNSDGASDPNAGYYYDAHFRYLYASAIKRKFIMLVIDVGSAMTGELLELTKAYVSNILQLLSDTDLISVVTIAAEADCMYLDIYRHEAAHGLYLATRAHKEEILNFINSLTPATTLTNHTLGFEYAFDLMHRIQNTSLLTKDNPIEFVYITRGLLNNLSVATQVLQVVAKGQKKLLKPIIINTCAVVLDEKRLMYEKQFLSDIATQNYTKYDINVDSWLKPKDSLLIRGQMFILTKTRPELLMRASLAIFDTLFVEDYVSESFDVHLPMMDAKNKDVIVSITYAMVPFGIVGVDLYLADLLEDIINYGQHDLNGNKLKTSYAFLVDRATGNTLSHPAFPRPSSQYQYVYPVDIAYLENATDFLAIRQRLLQEEHGSVTAETYQTLHQKQSLIERTYSWQSILGTYALCIVVNKGKGSDISPLMSADPMSSSMKSNYAQSPAHMAIPSYALSDGMQTFMPSSPYEYFPKFDLLYHRLDLLPPTTTAKICRYFRQTATMDAITLFLSSAAFDSPFSFLRNNNLEFIIPYIKDTSGLIANPGLRADIRAEVKAVYSAMEQLKKRHLDTRSSLTNYIIRRYIATVNGVLQVYPGCLIDSNYDATRRVWFRKAMQQPGKIITTEPYLDAGGAGFIITIAHTIFEGRASGLHSPDYDQPVAVVALDVPYAFYYKMILDSTPLCQQLNMKCLLFENDGFLVAHPSMLEPSTPIKNERRPHEHLTHKESYLSNDILNHKSLVRKFACANYQNRTLERYYVFNTTLSETLTNMVHGERTKYAIALVHGTNIFAAIMNSTCDGGAFCPCSKIDRICLNCNRMDQSDCECPCECPMEMDNYDDERLMSIEQPLVNYTQQYEYCMPPAENFIALSSNEEVNLLPACVSSNCDYYGSQQECLGVMGCEWCQIDLDGNIFSTPFCSAQTTCFNGVLSSATPYGELDDLDMLAARGYIPSQTTSSYSAFGPIGGAIILLAVIIGFAIYCYRHSIDGHAEEQFYIDSMQEENYGLPLSRFNFDDCQAMDDGGYDHPAAQRQLINPADISPYHVSTGSSYRRPPNNESDHGYSTMTPHEDSSEHQCFALAEPLLLNDKRHSKSDTMSISTSISSPTNRHHQQPTSYPHLPQPPTSAAASKVKESRYGITSPRKHHHHHQNASTTCSPARVYEQTTLPLSSCSDATAHVDSSMSPHYILAPVTVHRHMEPTES